MKQKIQMNEEWLKEMAAEFESPYMQKLKSFLQSQKEQRKVIYPKGEEYLNAFNKTPLSNVKVVILGQDPYHGPGQAHGLCFSVVKGVPPPPSLKNIYKELHSDLSGDASGEGFNIPPHGCLEAWADQGVLLLNSVLTVEARKAASHSKQGWEQFTDKAIQIVNEKLSNVVFLLWGSYAQKKAAFVNSSKHCILKSVHPSPLSAHRGFLGCKHFSKTNKYLISKGKAPIDWGKISV